LRVRTSIEVHKSFFQASLVPEKDAGLVGRIGIGGIEFDRALEARKCFAQTPRLEQSAHPVPPEIGIIRLEPHRLVEDLGGFLRSSEPQVRSAERRQI